MGAGPGPGQGAGDGSDHAEPYRQLVWDRRLAEVDERVGVLMPFGLMSRSPLLVPPRTGLYWAGSLAA